MNLRERLVTLKYRLEKIMEIPAIESEIAWKMMHKAIRDLDADFEQAGFSHNIFSVSDGSYTHEMSTMKMNIQHVIDELDLVLNNWTT